MPRNGAPTSLAHPMSAGRLMHEPAHGVVRQHPAMELLAYTVGRLATQYAPTLRSH